MPALTRLDAARKQLVTAINLHLLDVDPVSVHVLGHNALAILKGLLTEDGQRSLSDFADSHPALFGEIKDLRDFLSGSEKTGEACVNDSDNDALLFLACADYQNVTDKTELEIQLYGQWFLAINRDNIRDASFEKFPENIREQFFPPGLSAQPRVMQKQSGHALIVHLHDEMDKTAAPSEKDDWN
jgi:hypothetical protein